MKTRFLFPYWCRFLGYALFLLHIPIVLLTDSGHGFHFSSTDDSLFNGHHLFFISTTLMMAVGLFLVAFAKEKIEDEQISQLRLDSLQWSVYLNYLVLVLSLLLINGAETGHILRLNLWLPLVFFIVRFRWVIYRLNRSLSKDDAS